ncbi:Transcriptional regulatory protein QseB [Aliarcobacter thereius]|uniref:Response regulator transcription factor n=2 Tax=Aliarcobacter thereius TaxID=544718 RepID=A0A5R9H1V3_9BACT|nr:MULTISPECIES: response regulator transcription factor [Arcobacteraceae]OCL83245.1 Transcriptional regulatory protein QseB [Arcobacter porcinus]OCL87666.1 Transcriptional regulatory protein QseB [Aliarcobacter thereius]OCL95318.1 Transcriptional regulatory protein QseB [Aliarcobacter thereius LMG 24486]QBF16693.1 two-component system response regulator [Aliarcobacter thereius LMG 24486]TLS73157.1 response regulator transcription factor [Aliarcobacter thereius]
MRIFLLEDDFSLNESIKDMLESEGFNVDSFYDGDMAYQSISSDYTLYILDIFVPNLNGIELMDKIKKENKLATVFIMSANIDINMIEEAYKKGCDDYLKKPFNIQELLFKLKKYQDKQDNFMLSEGVYFNIIQNKLICNDDELELTKREKLFINLLISNQGKNVSYDLIEEYVYDGEFKSIDAIRSLVKRVRKKLPNNIIITNLDEGYYIK